MDLTFPGIGNILQVGARVNFEYGVENTEVKHAFLEVDGGEYAGWASSPLMVPDCPTMGNP